MTLSPSAGADLTVLVVCTGNICRSALAERLGRAYLEETLGDNADRVRLVSAGTRAVVGSEMHPQSALVLRGLGTEPGDFRARQLLPGHVAEADLVLTMTREHRRAVLELAPRSLARTFTLLEAADLLSRAAVPEASATGGPSADSRALIRALAEARSRRQVSDADDVADPIGRPLEAHQAAGDAIVASLLPLLSRLAATYTLPLAPETAGGVAA